MDHEPQQRQTPFRIDRAKQLQDIYIFEQKLREGAAEVERTRRKFQALMFSIVVLNGVAVWHALKWTLSTEDITLTGSLSIWDCTFSLLCAYLPVVLSGGCMCWIIFYYYQHVDDTATYVARCNSVLRSYRTYYCPNTAKLVVLRNSHPNPNPNPKQRPPPPHPANLPPQQHQQQQQQQQQQQHHQQQQQHHQHQQQAHEHAPPLRVGLVQRRVQS